MRERIVEFMDMVVEGLKSFIYNVTELGIWCISVLICVVIIISTPLWIIPYLIFRNKS